MTTCGNILNPEVIITGNMDGNGLDDVIVDLGKKYGLWIRMNNSSWVKLHSVSPEHITAADMDGNGLDDVVCDIGANGLWIRMNNSSWVKLPSVSP